MSFNQMPYLTRGCPGGLAVLVPGPQHGEHTDDELAAVQLPVDAAHSAHVSRGRVDTEQVRVAARLGAEDTYTRLFCACACA